MATEETAAPAPDAERVIELDTVRVTAPRPQPADPFAFRNPVQYEGTVLDRNWREPMSAEEIGMQGGIIHLALNYGLMKAAEQVTKLPGWRHQIQHATARPPPLDADAAARAARLQLAEENEAGNASPSGD